VWEVWQDDTYQLDRSQVVGHPVVDVGCNVGAFAVLASRLGASVVHAYEPVPRLAAVARVNVEANRARHVEVHEAAVGGSAGEAWLEDVAAGGAHLLDAQPAPYVVEGVEPRPVLRVPVVDVNDVILEAAGERDVGYLKVDCEGGEYAIVDGLKPDVLQRVRRLTMEFHGPAMPHLAHLDPGAWAPMVAKLAEYGRLRVFGRPSTGGLLWWERY
jgi:FkbM family methyltransferase